MKIYNRIIYDKDNNILLEDSYEYTGPIAHAGGDAVKAAIVVGAVAALPVAAGWTSGFTIGSLSPALSTFIVTAGSSLVLSTVNQKLMPDIAVPDVGTSLQPTTTVTVKEPTQPHRIVYGTTRVGGNIVFAETTDNQQYLHLVIAFTGHEISDFSRIYFGEDEVVLETTSNDSDGVPIFTPVSSNTYNGKARIKKHFGFDDQLADANLVSDVSQWTTNHRLRGRAYLYVRLDFDSDIYPNGVPNVTAEITGKKLFDIRQTSFTANTTNVSTSNNTITLTSHGLSTYDRFKYDTNSGTAIGGLTNGTEYFVIKVDNNTIKLATNYANALAGTAINLTSAPGSDETQKYNFTKHSDNPALAFRDYLTNTQYGLNAGTSEINDTNFTSVANTCEESVSLDSGTENRFTINGTFQVSQTPKLILQNMLSTIGGNLVYSNGEFKLAPAVYQTPALTLDESNLRSGLTVNTRVSKKELFNAVKGVYSEPDNLYQPTDYPILTNSTFETEDNSERIYADFDFPMTTSSKTCQRLAKIQLLKARQQITVVATFDLNAFELNIGDTVQITNSRFGFSSKTFEVTNWNITMQSDSSGSPALVVNCELRETASAVYDFATSDYSTVSSGKATNLAQATQVAAPTAITLTDELVQYNDGTVIVKLVIELTAPSDNFTEIFEVEIKQDTDADGNALSPADTFKLIGRGARTKFEFLNVIDEATYSVRARGVNIFGVKSSTITASRKIIGLIDPPSDVENFACNIVGKEAHLSFDPVPDLDLSHYRINYSPLTTGAEWQNSIVLVKKLSRPGTSIVVPAKTGTYLIKAVDKLGNVSINASSVVTQVTTIGEFTNLLTQNENPGFDGTKTNVVKTTLEDGSSALVLDSTELFDSATGNFDSVTSTLFDGGQDATVQSSGTYEFSQTVDAGAIVTTQITATLTQQVTDRARIFDFVTGDFDDQPSNFDGDANTQCSSELQIAVSDDNVTFSTFQDFTIGDYTARFFKFRVLMQSDNGSATPIVTAVGVTLQLEAFTVSENDVVSGTGTKAITYAKSFNLLNSIAITLSVQDMASGDKYAITGKTKTGFNIAFQNSSGTGISRTFDYVAKGV